MAGAAAEIQNDRQRAKAACLPRLCHGGPGGERRRRVDLTTAPFAGRDVLLVAAHPDDETLFAGAQLVTFGRLTILHTTDGATSPRAARRHGFTDRGAYAQARRDELRAALAAGGIAARCEGLGFRDRRLVAHMGAAADRLAEILRRSPPDLVLTHAYEGGHLDHDSTCFVVHEAVRRSGRALPIWEFAGYHVQDGVIARGAFPRDGVGQVVSVELDAAARAAKQRMLRCFATQREVIARFALAAESFRPAPAYDFDRPPFAGRLGYEIGAHGVESGLWRGIAIAERRPATGRLAWGRRAAKLRFAVARGTARLQRRLGRWFRRPAQSG